MRFRLPPWAGGFMMPLMLSLAWCAQPPAPTTPVSPVASIDGTYTGLATGSCGTDQAASVTLHDRQFTLAVGRERLDGTAAADGELSATRPMEGGGELNFTGHVQGKLLHGGSYNGRCAYAFELIRSPGGVASR